VDMQDNVVDGDSLIQMQIWDMLQQYK